MKAGGESITPHKKLSSADGSFLHLWAKLFQKINLKRFGMFKQQFLH